MRFAGKPDEARKLYERALVVNPSEPRARAGIAALETEQRLGAIVAQAQAALKSGDVDGAAERLRVVLMENPGQRDAQALQRLIEEQRVKAGFVAPVLRSRLTKPVSVQFRDANLRQVFDGLSRSTGINFIFDREVRADLKTTIFARDVSVEDAVDLILLPNQLEKKVLSENTVLVYPNTPAKQREYQDLVMKTFYLENADVKTTLNLVRTMLKTKDVFIDEKLNLLVMRDTPGGDPHRREADRRARPRRARGGARDRGARGGAHPPHRARHQVARPGDPRRDRHHRRRAHPRGSAPRPRPLVHHHLFALPERDAHGAQGRRPAPTCCPTRACACATARRRACSWAIACR